MMISGIKGKELLSKMIAEHLTVAINDSKWLFPYFIVIPTFVGDENIEFRIKIIKKETDEKKMEKEDVLFKLSFDKYGKTLHLNPHALHAFPEIKEDVINLFSVLDFNKRTL